MGKWITFYISDSGHVDSETGHWDEGRPDAPALTSRDDIYQPDFLRYLAKLCGIESPEWILRKFDPGRIVQVCCYALAKKESGQVRTGVRQIALAAFRDGYDVPDCRAKILPGITTRAPTSAETERKCEALAAVDDADRQAAAELLRTFLTQPTLFDLGDAGPTKDERPVVRKKTKRQSGH